MPPEPIADVLGAVLMLLGIRDTSWLSMKKFLGNRGVKEDILNFDARRIDPHLRAQVPFYYPNATYMHLWFRIVGARNDGEALK